MLQYRIGPETERLQHRAFQIEDAADFFKLNSHPDVMRYTGEPPLNSLDEARVAIESHRDFDQVGYGRWACIHKQTQTLIGFCGLKYLEDLDAVDIGYRFLPDYWGQGLATEACLASLGFGFNVIGLDQIIGLVLPENVASLRVLEKLGMHCTGPFSYDGFDVLRYVIERRLPRNKE